MDFGERLKNLRIKKGLTQEDVANALYVTRQAVCKWERGASLPDVDTLGKLAELYGTTADFLLTGEEKVKIEKEVEIVEKEKIVEVEKEVIKEKPVEVEKPLSQDEKEKILYKFKYIELKLYCGYALIITFIIMIIIFGALKSYIAIVPAFGLIISVPGAISLRRHYKEEYEKVEKYLDNYEKEKYKRTLKNFSKHKKKK